MFDRTSPVVEGLSLEEAFLDVRGLERIAGAPRAIAARLRRDVREAVGLAVTVGVARTRLLAKMASRAAKPDGLLESRAPTRRAFLHPLAVEALWGVGQKTARKLHARGIRTVADAAARSETELIGILGRAAGGHLHAAAHHREVRAVRPPPRRRSFGAQHALGRGPHGAAALDAVLLALADRVTRRMRAGAAHRPHADAAPALRRLHARVARADAAGADRGHADVIAAARELLAAAAPLVARRGCTLLGLSVGNLAEAPAQLALPLDGGAPATDAAIDAVRDRFGDAKLTRATLLNRGPELISAGRALGGPRVRSSRAGNPRTMRALVWHGPERMSVDELPDPEPAARRGPARPRGDRDLRLRPRGLPRDAGQPHAAADHGPRARRPGGRGRRGRRPRLAGPRRGGQPARARRRRARGDRAALHAARADRRPPAGRLRDARARARRPAALPAARRRPAARRAGGAVRERRPRRADRPRRGRGRPGRPGRRARRGHDRADGAAGRDPRRRGLDRASSSPNAERRAAAAALGADVGARRRRGRRRRRRRVRRRRPRDHPPARARAAAAGRLRGADRARRGRRPRSASTT